MTVTYDQLREQMLAGDTTITAAELDRARRDDEHAHLRQEADQRTAEREREQARQDQITDLLRRAGELEVPRDLQAQYRRVVEAGRAFAAGIDDYNRVLTALKAESKKLGADVKLPSPINRSWFVERANREAATSAEIGSIGVHPLHDNKARTAYQASRRGLA